MTGLLAVLGWLYLLTARHGFWRARPVIEHEPVREPATWPAVVAVVPARNEAALVGRALRSLFVQDYPGDFRIVLVDDHSEDATRAIGEGLRQAARPLDVIQAPPLEVGWTGKLWALRAGLDHAAQMVPDAAYIWFTDADVEHHPASLRRLVARAERDGADLVSLLVRLRCASPWERLLIPPFVFFFQKLYPFPAVNRPQRRIAAAAGGCSLVRRSALNQAGGLERIRHRLIDDVALARLIKSRGAGGHPIWLGLSAADVSLRGYERLAGVWQMVARSADEQLRHSLVLLLGTSLGMSLLYLVPPALLLLLPLHGAGLAALAGALAWLLMVIAYRPTARFYGLSTGWLATLPLAALLYLLMTVHSAVRFRRGRGGRWRGRVLIQRRA